jgi:hypothetical protein
MAQPYLHERLWVYRGTEIDAAVAAEQETYEYDTDGRLLAVTESPDLWQIADGHRFDTGGRLVFEYDEHGLKAIGDVWQRLDEPFDDLLARGAAAYEQAIVETLEQEVEPGTEAFALVVVYVAQGSLHPVIELGTERDDEDPLSYIYPETLGYPDVEDDEDLDTLLLSHAAVERPGDPYRLVHGEVCRRLARRDWGGLILPAEDFVVFCAEHDEDVEPKVEMIRAVNPPERVRHWEPVFRRLASEY